MYVYGFNVILKTVTKNRSDKEMIRDFIEFTTDLKIHGINQCFHFMDNESSTALKMEMTIMDINYKLVPPSNHREKYREIHSDVQNPFHSGTIQRRYIIPPTIVGHINTTGNNKSKYDKKIKNLAPPISLHRHIWRI